MAKCRASLVTQMVKNLPAMQETQVWSLHWEIPGDKNGNPLQYSCLENPMDRGAWWAAGYSPRSHKELDTTERLTLSLLYIAWTLPSWTFLRAQLSCMKHIRPAVDHLQRLFISRTEALPLKHWLPGPSPAPGPRPHHLPSVSMDPTPPGTSGKGIAQCLSFCVWLMSLSAVSFKVHPCGSTCQCHLFLRPNSIPSCGSCSIHPSSISAHLSISVSLSFLDKVTQVLRVLNVQVKQKT